MAAASAVGYDGGAPKLPDPLPSWYQKDVGEDVISAEARELLENYSGLETDQVLPHVLQVRDRGFAISPYPCIGQVKFLNHRFEHLHYWPYFQRALRAGASLLDVGCGLGQELRHLAYRHRVPESQLYAFDVEAAFVELGYDLFRDRGKTKIHFFDADLMAAPQLSSSSSSSSPPPPLPPRLAELDGTMDLIQVAQFLHVFDYGDQLEAAVRLARMTRARAGSMVAGHQMGSRNAGSYVMPSFNSSGGGGGVSTGKNYRHSPESMKAFWDEVGKATGTRWEVECSEIYSKAVEQNRKAAWAKADPGMCMIAFSAKRM